MNIEESLKLIPVFETDPDPVYLVEQLEACHGDLFRLFDVLSVRKNLHRGALYTCERILEDKPFLKQRWDAALERYSRASLVMCQRAALDELLEVAQDTESELTSSTRMAFLKWAAVVKTGQLKSGVVQEQVSDALMQLAKTLDASSTSEDNTDNS